MKRIIIVVVLLFFTPYIYNVYIVAQRSSVKRKQVTVQKQEKPSEFETLALSIPEISTHTVEGIAGYIQENFKIDSDKLKALYIWIAHNIDYDLKLAQTINMTSYDDVSKITTQALKSRSGVCVHYAQIFTDVANQMGIKSYTVAGYVKQNEKVITTLSHAWNCAFVDSEWYMFDPTWGSGGVADGKYIRNLNYSYFKVNPDIMIKTHMPFDPVWQLLDYPLTNREFYDQNFEEHKSRIYFNYVDSIAKYNNNMEIASLSASAKRIENNGLINDLVEEYYQFQRQNANMLLFNDAVTDYNKAVQDLNVLIMYRNKQFKPEKEQEEMHNWLKEIEENLLKSKKNLRQINKPKSELSRNRLELNEKIEEVNKSLKEQSDFIDKYFNTGKIFRSALFKKYSIYGIPLN